MLRPGLRDSTLGDEGYVLRVEPEHAVLEAAGGRGLFYAAQTLRQLVIRGPRTTLAGCRVRDWPAWPYRGVMHDPARNFMTLDFLRHQIDILPSYKLNYFHLHLTDNQGWRVEIKSHPQLASDQHYTQQELTDLVAYAKARFVTLMPETEMPGHAGAFVRVEKGEVKLVDNFIGGGAGRYFLQAEPGATQSVRGNTFSTTTTAT